MTAALAVFLSLRKFFGAVIPGFCWVLLAWWRWPELRHTILSRTDGVPGEAVLLGAVVLVASYIAGAAMTVWSFRILELIGDGLDRVARWANRGFGQRLIRFLQTRLHLINPCTLAEEMALRLPQLQQDPLRGTGATDEVGIAQWDVYKMYLLQESPTLGREDLEIEADINFHAGMFMPTAVVAIGLTLTGHVAVGVLLLLICGVIALRFQNLRHHEIIYVAQAYHVIRVSRTHEGV